MEKPKLVWIAFSPYDKEDVQIKHSEPEYTHALFVDSDDTKEGYIAFEPYILTPVDVD
jgi:protein tyrosine phosphatase